MNSDRSTKSFYRNPDSKSKKRILIGDPDGQLARRLAEQFWQYGFDARTTYTVSEAREIIEFWKPDVVIMDLANALTLFRFFSTKKMLKRPAVIVTARKATAEVSEQVRRIGATAILEKPFSVEQVLERVNGVIRAEPEVKEVAAIVHKTQELHLLNIFLRQAITSPGDSHCLHNLMRMVSLRTGALRASIIQCQNFKKGVVLASNDDALVRGLALDLAKYPEVLMTMADEKWRYIADTKTCEVLTPVQRQLQKTGYEALALFPLYCDGKFFGVMSLRLKRLIPEEATYVQKLGDLTSKIISLTLRHTPEAAAA